MMGAKKMAKRVSTKKPKRRLKRQVRKTFAAVLMITAIIIGAIPVPDLAAEMAAGDAPASSILLEDVESIVGDSQIPTIPDDEPVYTTGDGMFQFVYMSKPGRVNKYAIIVGFEGTLLPADNSLVIPDEVDAYMKYTDTLGSKNGYVAATIDGDPCYYKKITQAADPDKGVAEVSSYEPCWYLERDNWIKETKFYDSNGVERNRLQSATVTYIANQRAVQDMTGGEWSWTWKFVTIDGTAGKEGIFQGASNIRTLTIGQEMVGIGNYAFQNCTALAEITLGTNLGIIGKRAFSGCISMTRCNMKTFSMLKAIGEYAFYDCRSLESISIPQSVFKICDSAFEGCTALTGVMFEGIGSDGKAYLTSLTDMGDRVFAGCTSLQEITLPVSFENIGSNTFSGCTGLENVIFGEKYSKNIPISIFKGCINLSYLKIPNIVCTLVEDSVGKVADFVELVPDHFYFEGIGPSPTSSTGSNIYQFAKTNALAFKYIGYDKYEQTINGYVYQANSQNTLTRVEIPSGKSTVEIPIFIGPYTISVIGSDALQGNVQLTELTVPSTITTIGANAFKACYKLGSVIFEEPVNLTTIESGAFSTQEVSNAVLEANGDTLPSKPSLKFTGTISYESVPFAYAMQPTSYINRGSQELTYIDFHSPSPANLVVQYNPNTKYNELISYPRLENASAEDAAAISKYKANTALTEDEKKIVDSYLHIVLPSGIESFGTGAFSERNAANWTVGASGYDAGTKANDDLESITMYSVQNIPDNAFYGCERLYGVTMYSSMSANGETIGNYAFGDCDNLTSVSLASTATTMGKIPFTDCAKLTYVDFQDGTHFVCDEGIIYGLKNGSKYSIVECLETRGVKGNPSVGSATVYAKEVSGVSAIQDEAFKNCDGIGIVDLSSTAVTKIPTSCFEDTDKLAYVLFPDTLTTIGVDAFKDSNVFSLTIPSSVSYIDVSAFKDSSGLMNTFVTIDCDNPSAAYTFAREYGMTLGTVTLPKFTVIFYDGDTILSTQKVSAGEDAVPPADPVREGYAFTGWSPSYKGIAMDTSIVAQFAYDASAYTVKFIDHDGTVLKEASGGLNTFVKPPENPVRAGYVFKGWSSDDYMSVTQDCIIIAMYDSTGTDAVNGPYTVSFYDGDGKLLTSESVAKGGSATAPAAPTKSGHTFTGWSTSYSNIQANTVVLALFKANSSSDGTDDGTKYAVTVTGGTGGGSYAKDATVTIKAADPETGKTFDKWTTSSSGVTFANAGSSTTTFTMPANAVTVVATYKDGTDATKYKVTVTGGAGSGTYAADSTVTITADTAPAGKVFDKWTTGSNGVTFASATTNVTTFKMPANEVTVMATYKDSTSTGTGTGAGTGTGGTGTGTGGTGSTKGTTAISITKSGIPSHELAFANVNGSPDNFVIKITESDEARVAIQQALREDFDTLEYITFFPMDISIYDETGTELIEDVSGLAIDITMPIPSDMVQYAGNNKVASVVNGKLEKIDAKFKTIDGVACISFTATHFSPYTIYVDTDHLDAAQIGDTTPKTGDGIHPKWFLVIGLASMSAVLFLMKDNKRSKVKLA